MEGQLAGEHAMGEVLGYGEALRKVRERLSCCRVLCLSLLQMRDMSATIIHSEGEGRRCAGRK